MGVVNTLENAGTAAALVWKNVGSMPVFPSRDLHLLASVNLLMQFFDNTKYTSCWTEFLCWILGSEHG